MTYPEKKYARTLNAGRNINGTIIIACPSCSSLFLKIHINRIAVNNPRIIKLSIIIIYPPV
ncbi:MAG: hypothetical protein ACI4KH_02335 [Oscillospiraceae bacterium]